VEFALLRRALHARIGRVEFALGFVARLWLAAVVAAGTAWGIKTVATTGNPILLSVLTLIPYGIMYFGVAAVLGIPEGQAMIARLVTRRR
jgi:hypothetical protein